MIDNYLKRYAYPKRYLNLEYQNKSLYTIIVLPAHHEEHLIQALASIEDCDAPTESVCVITVINASEVADQQIKDFHQDQLVECIDWAAQDRKFDFHFILENELPKKHAGVGLARKIGMDEAVRIFHEADVDGVILCYDADSSCASNLLVEVQQLFQKDKTIPGCSIHYEHPLEGELSEFQYDGIVKYELHLRYYVDALKYAEYPYAFQTIGSSMAARMSAYVKQGGMNRRKAGEDFYFLHRNIPLGNFKNLNTTTVYPSARESDRVPFGTGRAISQWMGQETYIWPTYDFRIFEVLKNFFTQAKKLYGLEDVMVFYEGMSEELKSYFSHEEFEKQISEINRQSKSEEAFHKRFYQWIDGFQVLKMVHHLRDQYYPNIPIEKAVGWILNKYEKHIPDQDAVEMLHRLRVIDKEEKLISD
ncbi:MAG: hypothetical protein OCD76_18435 [Reichenbachiella sp.]